MDPLTIAVVVAVVAVVAMNGPKKPELDVAVAQPAVVPTQDVPPLAGAIFDGAANASAGFRRTMDGVLVNTFATAKQRATSLSGGMDPAFVSSGSAIAARELVTRGLATTRDATAKVAAASWAYSPLALAGRTQTGQALQQAAQTTVTRTAAEVAAAGGSVAEATAQAATNAATAAANAAANADAATAAFIQRNSPF